MGRRNGKAHRSRSAAVRWLAVAAAGLGVVLVLAACGGGDEESTATEAPPATEAATTEAVETAPAETEAAETAAPAETQAAEPVTDYVAFVGGTDGPADPSLPSVTIGYVNQQGGAQDFGPLSTEGAELTVQYVNEYLGGVQGHPVQLETCFITTSEEEGQQCAQQFANNDDVDVIAMGAVAIGNESLYSTIGGAKPFVLVVGNNAADGVQENSFILFGDQLTILGPWGTFGRDVLQAKTAAVVYPEIAGIQRGAGVVADALEAAGIETKKVGYSPEATDLVGPLTAAGAQDADMFVPFGEVKACVNLAKALDQVGSDASVVPNPICLSGLVAEALGGDLPQWIYGIAASLTGDVSDPSVKAEVDVLTMYGKEDLAGDVWVQIAFSQILTIVKLMNEIGYDNLSPETISEAFRAFTGPIPMGPPTIACGKYPELPASCNDQTNFFQYLGAGKFERASGWLEPPEGFTLSG